MTQKTIPQEIAEIEAALTAARTVASGATADESVQVAMATISNSVGSALTVMYRLSLQIDALGEGMEALHGQVEGVIDVMPARRATGGTLDEIRAGAGSPEPQPVVVSAAPPPDAAAAPVDTGPTEFLKPLNFQFGGRTEFATIRYKRWLRHSAKAVLIVASDGNEYWVPNKMCVFDLKGCEV